MIKSWQIKTIFIVGIVCTVIVFAIDYRGFACLIQFLVSFIMIYFGNKIFTKDTTENWLYLRLSDTLKSIIGGALILIGGLLYLRLVLGLAIGALILKFS